MKHLIVLASLLLAVPVVAQDVQAELRTKEQAARGDASALTEVALWARENGLDSDAGRILKKALEIDSRHVGANVAVGNVEYLGHWMTRSEMFKNMGLVEFEGVWIEKDQRNDAKEGVFHNGEELITRDELAAFQLGMMRHPKTGEFIPEADSIKAQQNLYPLGEGKWGTLEEANEYHSSPETPWVVRTNHTTLISTMPLEGSPSVYEAWPFIEYGHMMVTEMFGMEPSPANRPLIFVVPTAELYSELGNAFGGAESSHAVFVAEEASAEVPGIEGFAQPVFINYGEKNWEGINLRHAGALACVESLRRDIDAPPLQGWFMRGIGASAGRLPEPKWGGANGEQDIMNSGGVNENIKQWFDSFGLGGGMSWQQMAHNIYQAGLMIRFAQGYGEEGPDGRVSDAWADIVEVFQDHNGRGAFRAIDKLQKSYYTKYDELRDYMRWLISQKGT